MQANQTQVINSLAPIKTDLRVDITSSRNMNAILIALLDVIFKGFIE